MVFLKWSVQFWISMHNTSMAPKRSQSINLSFIIATSNGLNIIHWLKVPLSTLWIAIPCLFMECQMLCLPALLYQICKFHPHCYFPILLFCQVHFSSLPMPLCQIVKSTLLKLNLLPVCQIVRLMLPTPLHGWNVQSDIINFDFLCDV